MKTSGILGSNTRAFLDGHLKLGVSQVGQPGKMSELDNQTGNSNRKILWKVVPRKRHRLQMVMWWK